ncbi:NTF2-like N-terminal transpeptidase domain-containing protein [Rhodococcus sp. IEGM 1379]|uniref:NTF2-like N-terminal transpeptidase domain-containing protein n=1 Tax=Rhodococcus sp. IEGM 1379 TaxID=3047086 RepID=UPI0024B67660|nr:NTF2-like N-terminal transpeptidase domain-containing protein [Rhodococcus sp. IEGM 1379]MDI9917396.1 NTF2-like N-terminal transpeptidase domain-containing protein [Rhodococcus sp. IEGM 1379]
MGTGAQISRRGKYVIASIAAVVMTVALASCVVGGDKKTDAASVVEDFVNALNNRDIDAAADLTSYPNAARASIAQMFDGLDAKSTDFDVAQVMDLGSDSAFFTLDAAWNFGEGKDWTYQSQGEVRDLSVGWRLSWDPAVIVPGLGNGRTVSYTRTDAAPPKVVDAGGALLMNEQTINAITLDPATMPDPVDTTTRLAKVIEPVAPLVTSESMLADLAANPGKQVTAVLLRDPDYAYLESDFAIPGVVVVKTPKLIASDRRISSPLLDPLRTVWQANRDATAGWAVNLVDSGGAPTKQAGFQGPPGPDVAATLDSHTQLAAIEAVVSAGTPAAIVAIRPSDGAILAAAQNNQAIEQGPIAFTGLRPAGGALDLVRLAASVKNGVDPRAVSPEQLTDTAQQLGLGNGFNIPGLDQQTAVFASDRPGSNQSVSNILASNKTANTGDPQVTPFGMAMLAASIARGSAPTPMMVFGQPATTDVAASPLPADVNNRLRDSMRGAGGLVGYPDLIAAGAASGDDRWFFGSRGDLAFAVLVADADGGDRAMQMTEKLLQELGKPADK